MKKTRMAGAIVGAAVMFAAVPLAPASAINNIKGFGVEMTLASPGSEIGYTVRNLRPSRDAVPYPLAGRLFAADATAEAVGGLVFPSPTSFLARTSRGIDYRALPVSTLSGAPLGQGAQASGKLYFDVVGPDPDSVIFNDQFQDLLGWVGLQPVDPAGITPGTEASGGTSGTTGTGGNVGFQGSPGAFGVAPPPGPANPSASLPDAGTPVGAAQNTPNQNNAAPPVVGGRQTGANT